MVAGIAYRIIKKSTGRPVYSIEHKKQHSQNREILLNIYNAQPINFVTEDGVKLSGLLMLRAGAKRNLLFCHGYRMCKERLISFVSMFPQDNILLFDYRAHGESQGDRTTIGYDERKDVFAALSVLQAHEVTKNLPIFGVGISMGAVSLLGAACESNDFKGLILDSPFAQLDTQARKTFSYKFKIPIVPFESVARKMFEYIMQFSLTEVDSLKFAKKASMPIMVIHSKIDAVASFEDAQKLYGSIEAQKDFWAVDSSSHAHIFTDLKDEYSKRANHFFDSIAI